MITLHQGGISNQLKANIAMLALAAGLALPAAAHAQTAITGDVTTQDRGKADIVVSGQQLSRDMSIADKKASIGVIDVISADDLGKLPDASVADSLGRIPGVSVIVNQDTGEGQYVTIRGLGGTYNAYTINGVRVAQTDPASRDVSLNLLPPNGLAAVTVAKTQTPDMDGDAIAGAIDFRTPNAFDFKKKTTARIYASGGFNDRAQSSGEPSANGQIQGDFATRFGEDRFGIFISADYGVSHGNGQEVENDGEWEPYKWKADDSEPIDYHTLQLPGIDLDYRRLKQTRLGGNFSLDYHGDTTKLYLRGQYAQLKLRGTNDTTEYNDTETPRLVQVNQNDTSLIQPSQAVIGTGAKGKIYSYTPQQIVDADGDGMITDADATGSGYWSLQGRSGVWNPQAFEFGREQEVIDSNQYLGTLQGGGHSDLGRLHLDYDVSMSIGKQSTPDDYSIEYLCDACSSALMTPVQWVSSDPRFPHPATTAAADAVQRDSSLLPLDGGELEKGYQRDTRFAVKLDARYDFDGILEYVKVGGKFTRSHRKFVDDTVWEGDFSGTPLDGLDLADSGLVQKNVSSILEGRYYYGDVYSRKAVIAAINAGIAATPGAGVGPEDTFGQDTKSTEKVYAGYALAHFKINTLDVVTGGRVEHAIPSTNSTSPTATISRPARRRAVTPCSCRASPPRCGPPTSRSIARRSGRAIRRPNMAISPAPRRSRAIPAAATSSAFHAAIPISSRRGRPTSMSRPNIIPIIRA
jgi:iron complex outermembrane recepter protein